MGKPYLFSTALTTLLSTSAVCADLSTVTSTPALAPSQWTGVYAGLNAGATWANNNGVNIYTWPTKALSGYFVTSAPLNGVVATGSALGVIGGGQIGASWQMNIGGHGIVSGLEADIQGLSNSKNAGHLPFSVAVLTFSGHDQYTTITSTTATNSLSFLGTVRGRLGLVLTPTLLVYATGGLAYGQVNLGINQFQQFGSALGSGYSSTSATPAGWTAGGGVEWMFLPNWSVKAEYLYYDLGNQNSNTNFIAWGQLGGQYTYGSASTTQFSGNVVRAGVNYHIDFASVSAPTK